MHMNHVPIICHPSLPYLTVFLSSFLLLNYSLYSLINRPLSSLFHGRALMTEMGMRTEPWIWAGLEGWGRAAEAQCWPPCSPCRPSGRPCSTATATRWARQTAGTCLWTTPRSNAWTRTTRRYYPSPHPGNPLSLARDGLEHLRHIT